MRAELARATRCNCSICSKKGFIHLIVEPSQFELLAGADALVSYRFNTGVAEHKFCKNCGIHPFYTPRSDPDKVDVNVRCLDNVDPNQLELLLFDGKHWEEAIKTAGWRAGEGETDKSGANSPRAVLTAVRRSGPIAQNASDRTGCRHLRHGRRDHR